MSKVFSARFSIQGSIDTGTPGEFDVFGDVVDQSLDGFSVSDVQVGDLVYDENVLDGSITRWVVTQVVATGPGSIFGGGGATACHLVVQFDDEGTTPSSGPAAGTGAIARSSDGGLAEVPSQSTKGISEALSNQIRNIDNRTIVDPVIVGGGGGGGESTSTKVIQNNYTNSSGGTILALKPVRSSSGTLATVDPSIEAHVLSILGVTKTNISNGVAGTVVLEGLMEDITTSIAVDKYVYLSKAGNITDEVPDIGVGGFVEGDFVVKIGQIVRNTNNPAKKDLNVDIRIIGQL